MDLRKAPIGVFDSGLGGISVLRELVKLMPNENYIYLGDSKNAPYGDKEVDEVRQLTIASVDCLIDLGVKALVIACNTATSAAVNSIRKQYNKIPVIGIEPALKPAVLSMEHPRVIVMATSVTLAEEKFNQLMMAYKDTADIVKLPCPGLAEYVEQGKISGPEVRQFLTSLLEPHLSPLPDAIVLGCTHYPFVRDEIQSICGSHVTIFDGGMGTALETRRRLAQNNCLAAPDNAPYIKILNTLNNEMINRSENLLKL